jgi:exopolyphosphatase / guanosine-5'-triphosphate,3'-diphosphate pyrophosphatase
MASACDYEVGHSHQVTRLALELFDGLQTLHKLSLTDRSLLECAGLLHDVGWASGQRKHHKTTLRIIMGWDFEHLDDRERSMAASIARYHRRALPDAKKHAHFAELARSDREIVCKLAALLRVADGLDRSHTDAVTHVECDVKKSRVLLRCQCTGPADSEYIAGMKKASLFEKIFDRTLDIEIAESVDTP